MDNYFFLLKNFDNTTKKQLLKILKQLKIKNIEKDDNIYIFLNNYNVINYFYNLLLISVICNIIQCKNVKIKLNKNMLLNKKNIGIELVKLFNTIKNYELTEVKKDKKTDITIKNNTINLKSKDCIIKQKNNDIKDILKVLLNEKYEKLLELIELINKKKKTNYYLKYFNSIILNNLELKKEKVKEVVINGEELFDF